MSEENLPHILRKPKPDDNLLADKPGYSFLLQPEWLDSNTDAPLCLDIGAGMGRFLLTEAERLKDWRFVGIDPVYQCAKRVLKKLQNREKRGEEVTGRVRWYYGSIYHFLPLLRERCVSRVYLNYPDPWFKKRHLKRRLLSPLLFERLAPVLKPGAEVFIQTDITNYAEEIQELLQSLKNFDKTDDAEALFKNLPGTLYQEKAEKADHPRHCFHLIYREEN